MFKMGPKKDQNLPKNEENQANWPKNIQKVRKLMQYFYSGQKTQDIHIKSYCCWPQTYWAAPAQLPTQFAKGPENVSCKGFVSPCMVKVNS